MGDNPLARYYRQPAIYLRLPSQGRFWKQGSLDMPPNGEIPVLPMSGKDDISIRNADGLMNGSTTVNIIESCCPNIKDAWQCPSVDLDAIMIAIRLASYGSKMAFETKCNNCQEDLSYEVDLGGLLSSITLPDYDKPIDINGLLVYLKPNDYSASNDINQQRYVQQRLIKSITSSDLPEEQKIEKFKQALAEMTSATVRKLTDFVDHVITPDGTRVTDPQHIKDFVENADQHTYNTIKDGIFEKNKQYALRDIDIKCGSCNHEDRRAFQFDPGNFFG